MKKILIIILMVMAITSELFAFTCTFQSGGVDLNWSTAGNWTNCNSTIPQSGDTVKMTTGLIAVWDAGALTIPASGSLASLSTTNATDTAQISLANAICEEASGGCNLNVTGDITAGYKPTAAGFILISGSSTHTVTITAANVIGGGNTGAIGILNTSTAGTVAIVGHVKGGSGVSAYGFASTGNGATNTVSNGAEGGSGTGACGYDHGGTGATTITGNLTAGSGVRACGVYNETSSTGEVTLVNSNLINSTTSVAYAGRPPVWNPGNTNYTQWYADGGNKTFYFDTDPGIANVKKDTTYYFQSGTVKTGTYAVGGGGAWGF